MLLGSAMPDLRQEECHLGYDLRREGDVGALTEIGDDALDRASGRSWSAGFHAIGMSHLDGAYRESAIGGLLTTRERDIHALISRGLSNKSVARSLEISPETVKTHVKHIFSKLAVGTRAEAVCRAGWLGLL